MLLCRFARLPVCDEDFVGPFSLLDDRVLPVAALLVVVGRSQLAVATSPGRCPRGPVRACGRSWVTSLSGNRMSSSLLIRPCTGAELPDWRTFGFSPT
jgi:hypothetical protein